jgi:spermidine synthase
MPANKAEPGRRSALPAPLFYTGAMSLDPAPLVRTRGNRRTLEFAPGDIQSEMLLSHPDMRWCWPMRAR